MPEILKNNSGETNWNLIISAFFAGAILLLQQFQTYRIAEIKAQAEVNKQQLLTADEIETKIEKHIKSLVDVARAEHKTLLQRMDKLEEKVK